MSICDVNSIILDIINSAKKYENVFYNDIDALITLITNSDIEFTLSYKKLFDNNHDNNFHIWDITIGFSAITDVSFDMMVDVYYEKGPKCHISIPVKMKAGEFQLIWHKTNVFPNIRMGFHNIWFKNVSGDVRIIGCHLNHILRNKLSISNHDILNINI
jgi:hypothetical protein